VALGGVMLTRHSPAFRHGVARLRARFPLGSAAISRRSRRWPRAVRYLVLRTDPRRVAPLSGGSRRVFDRPERVRQLSGGEQG
jgi:hypothetical protein